MSEMVKKLFITKTEQAAFLFWNKLHNHKKIYIVEQVVNGLFGWEVDTTDEVRELLREFDNNPLIPLQTYLEISKNLRVKISLWKSLSRRTVNAGYR